MRGMKKPNSLILRIITGLVAAALIAGPALAEPCGGADGGGRPPVKPSPTAVIVIE